MKTLISVLLGILLFGCGTSNKIVEPTADSKRLDAMVAAQAFNIELDWVEPFLTNGLTQVLNSGLLPPGSNLSRINIQGNGKLFKMEGDSVQGDLPYWGERQFGGGYGSPGGIEFNGIARDLLIKKIERKQAYQIEFKISEKTESYRVSMNVFANLTVNIRITSSNRFSIAYQGRVVPPEIPDDTTLKSTRDTFAF